MKQFYKHQTAAGHHNEKFLCEVCGNEFHSKFLMNQHMRRTHMKKGGKFYKTKKNFIYFQVIINIFFFFLVYESLSCHICSKEFEKKYNLELHIKRVHEMEAQTCNICFAKFSSSNNLNQHIKQAHMDAPSVSFYHFTFTI